MSGDTSNAQLWTEADVYVAPLATVAPTSGTATWPAGWELVGLLDGEDGFTTTREQDTNDLYAWGGILVRTSRRNFKLTKSFSALENNDVTRDLVWPDSPAGQIIVPRPKDILIGFETREGDVYHRLISAERAQVDVDGDIVENETDLTKYELVATIFPTADGVLFTEQGFTVTPPPLRTGDVATDSPTNGSTTTSGSTSSTTSTKQTATTSA